MRASSSTGIGGRPNISIKACCVGRSDGDLAPARLYALIQSQRSPRPVRSASRSNEQRSQSLSCVSSSGAATNAPSAWPNSGAGEKATSPSVSTSTRLRILSPWRAAKRAAIAPPWMWPTNAGAVGQVRSISASSQASTPSMSSGGSTPSEAPWPGRSGATTRWVATRSGSTRSHFAACSPGPWSSSSGGPAPPSSTAVPMPASV